MKDSRIPKIVSTCFASGAITLLTLLIAAPSLGVLWSVLVSVIVGGSVGYFGFQFREVLRAIPKAASASIPAVLRVFSKIREFFSKPRPFLFGDLLVSAVSSFLFVTNNHSTRLNERGLLILGSLFVFTFFIAIALFQVLFLGMPLEWRDSTSEKWNLRRKSSLEINKVLNANFPQEVLFASISWKHMLELHLDALMNVVIGVFLIVVYLIVGITAIAPVAIYFSGKFFWYLFKIIHSDHRLICGVNGPLGGLAVFFALWAYHGSNFAAIPALEKIAFVMVAGVVSISLGLVAHFFIGLRWLKKLAQEI